MFKVLVFFIIKMRDKRPARLWVHTWIGGDFVENAAVLFFDGLHLLNGFSKRGAGVWVHDDLPEQSSIDS